jgi:hypothetical protein
MESSLGQHLSGLMSAISEALAADPRYIILGAVTLVVWSLHLALRTLREQPGAKSRGK